VFKEHTDRKLIEGIKKGENNTIKYLYESYFDTVKSHIIKNTGSEDDAYDVFQDALMVLFKKIQANNFELTSDLKAYVFGISRNLWNNQLRKKKKETSIIADVADDFDLEKILDTPIEQIVQRSFLKLSPECQEVLSLFMEGQTYEKIASEMNYKSSTYARRKKYLCKESLMKIIKSDPEFKDYEGFDL